jgi:hypothetical protein
MDATIKKMESIILLQIETSKALKEILKLLENEKHENN